MATPGVGEIRGIVTLGTMEDGTADGMTRGTTAVGDMVVIITTTTMTSSAKEAAESTRPVFPRQAPPTEAVSDPLQGQQVSGVHQRPEPEVRPVPQGQGFPPQREGRQASADAAEVPDRH